MAALLAGVFLPHTPASAGLASALPGSPQGGAEREGRVIVKFKSGSALVTEGSRAIKPRIDRAQRLAKRLNLALESGRDVGPNEQVLRSASASSAALAAMLSAQSDVDYAVPDERRYPAGLTPNDTYYSSAQWYLHTPDGTDVSAIDATTAWVQSKGDGLVVAVLDTGVRYDHSDLSGKLLPGYDMVSAETWNGKAVYCTANDSNARDADATDPGDWVLATEVGGAGSMFPRDLCSVTDSSWHGSKVSGILGASTANGKGIAGVGWNTKILPVRVVGKCGGWDADIIAGMRWAANLAPAASDTLPANPNPARVLNMSLSGSANCSAAYTNVIADLTAAGVTVVAAAGNGANESGPGGPVVAPANCPGVVAVGGLSRDGTKAAYANLGPAVTISAPSGDSAEANGIATTTNKGTTAPGAEGYTVGAGAGTGVAGTSFSTPIVSGTVALMLAADDRLQSGDVINVLKRSARRFPSGAPVCDLTLTAANCYCTTATCGAGMLDAAAAVAAAVNGPHPRLKTSVSAPEATVAFTLDAGSSLARKGSSLVSWRWTLVDGGGIVTPASLQSPATRSTAVVASGPGQFVVKLSVTDATGREASVNQAITVRATGSTATAAAPASASAQVQTAGATLAAATSVRDAVAGSNDQPVLACTVNNTPATTPTDPADPAASNPVATGDPVTTAGGGGGGGASSLLFLVLLGSAVIAAAALRRWAPGTPVQAA